MKLTRAKRTTPLRGPPSGRQGAMTTTRSVETWFCTASDTMAENYNCLDEIELSATDVMLAKLTLSPCHTSTQLSVSADPPIKHGRKAKGRTKKANTLRTTVVQTQRQRNRQHGTMPPVRAVGTLRMRGRTARNDHWLVELPDMSEIAGYCCETCEHCIKTRGDIDAGKRQQCRTSSIQYK